MLLLPPLLLSLSLRGIIHVGGGWFSKEMSVCAGYMRNEPGQEIEKYVNARSRKGKAGA